MLYLAAAFSGYASFLDKTPKLVIDRKALPNSFDHDYLMLIGRVGTLLLIVIGIPVICAPCR